ITPSLDEMVHVAKEMERRAMDLPLLIGGATTSKQHTAVRIAPAYHAVTVHVKDASRVTHVTSALVDTERRKALDVQNRALQEDLRELHRQKVSHPLIPYPRAVERRLQVEWEPSMVATPAFTGVRTLEDFPLGELLDYIDWTFFFAAWEIKGPYPKVLDHPQYGAVARELFENGRTLLRRIVEEHLLTASGCYGFWPANSDGDDLVVWRDETRSEELARFPMLRQQRTSDDNKPTLSLADFVAPIESGLPDHIGAFAVTAGRGAEELAAR